ncbi:MAG: hydrolase, partial [bacterium]
PRVVIPMHYKINGLKIDLDTVDKFAKEAGVKKENLNVAKVVLKKKTLPEADNNEIYIMALSS